MSPFTSSLDSGAVLPIPTFPADNIVIESTRELLVFM